MKLCTTLLLISFPFLTQEKAFPLPPIISIGSPALIDVGRLAAVMNGEARNQGEVGQIWVADVLKNRCAISGKSIAEESERGFYAKPGATHETWALAVRVVKSKPIHPYTFFFNPETATDKRFVRWAKTRQGEQFKSHYFFSTKQKHDIQRAGRRNNHLHTQRNRQPLDLLLCNR